MNIAGKRDNLKNVQVILQVSERVFLLSLQAEYTIASKHNSQNSGGSCGWAPNTSSAFRRGCDCSRAGSWKAVTVTPLRRRWSNCTRDSRSLSSSGPSCTSTIGQHTHSKSVGEHAQRQRKSRTKKEKRAKTVTTRLHVYDLQGAQGPHAGERRPRTDLLEVAQMQVLHACHLDGNGKHTQTHTGGPSSNAVQKTTKTGETSNIRRPRSAAGKEH